VSFFAVGHDIVQTKVSACELQWSVKLCHSDIKELGGPFDVIILSDWYVAVCHEVSFVICE
jgi:hypothetical protein